MAVAPIGPLANQQDIEFAAFDLAGPMGAASAVGRTSLGFLPNFRTGGALTRQQARGKLAKFENRRANKLKQLEKANKLADELGLSPSQLDLSHDSATQLLNGIGQFAQSIQSQRAASGGRMPFSKAREKAIDIMGIPKEEVDRAERIIESFEPIGRFDRGGAEELGSIEKGIQRASELDIMIDHLKQVLGLSR